MKFEEWVESKRGDDSRTAFLRTFSKKCGVSVQTLQSVVKGARISFYQRAKAISEATGDEVTVQDLCE